MATVECQPKAFDLHREAGRIVVAKRRLNVAGGIVNGIIVDLLAFPLFAVALVVGAWVLIVTLTEEHSFLLLFVGLMFVGGSIGLMRFFLRGQSAFFPYEVRFKKGTDGSWTAQRKLWFLSFPWLKLGSDWRMWCYPWWSKGDWGYVLFMKTKRARFFLARSPAIADSKSEAEKAAQNDLATLKALLDIPGELKGWSFDVQHRRNIGLAVITLSVLAIAVCCWLVARYGHR